MPLKYLLDTKICIYITKKKPESVLQKFSELKVGEVGMSIITYAELQYGAQKSQAKKKTINLLQSLVNFIPVLPMSIDTSEYYADIRAKLEKKGMIIGNNDLWIASHALSLNVSLVTNNLKEFSRVPKLKLENWV